MNDDWRRLRVQRASDEVDPFNGPGRVARWRHAHSLDPLCFDPEFWMPMPKSPRALGLSSR